MVNSRPVEQRRELRVALVGAGKMGMNHIRAMRGCTGARLVALADPQADRSELEAVLSPGVEILRSADELFERVRPDVVHIVTPPASHAPLARAALLSGAHVYVEKPFTLKRDDAEAVLSLAADRGLQMCAGHQCLFDHASIVGQKALSNIGTVVHVESYFSFRTVRKSISPVDQAMDILPHAVYMLLAFMRGSADRTASPPSIQGLSVTAAGDVYGVLKRGDCHGVLKVTLRGRPVEQYVHVIGTNGSMRVDLVSGAVVTLAGAGANIVAAMVNPYRHAAQTVAGSTTGFVRHIRERKYGYPGLRRLFQSFYESVRGAAPPIPATAIIETVAVCEQVGSALADAAAQEDQQARLALTRAEQQLPLVAEDRGVVLVTGAGGFLGRLIVRDLRARGRRVRALTRRPPRFVQREPGVEYRECDLAAGLAPDLMTGVTAVVHAAAETKGGKAEQERNSIRAAQLTLEAAAAAGVTCFLHISSVAVLKPATRRDEALDEDGPLDPSLERGPYVWGKAESERLVVELGRKRGVDVRVVRLGPLVDFAAFEPPGRLGRELGPWFVAVGPRNSRIALIDVGRAAMTIAAAIEVYEHTPAVVNLVEPSGPTRAELMARFLTGRADLRVVWIPIWLLRLASPPLKVLQRLAFGAKRPLDIASAFETPRYQTARAAEMIERAVAVSSARRAQAVAVYEG